MPYQKCINCNSEYNIDEIVYFCKKCGDLLEIEYDQSELNQALKENEWRNAPLSVWRYRIFMPVKHSSKIVTLNEGGTGLHLCQRLTTRLGIRQLYVKNEGENPTGSFKDRGMTVGVTKATELGAKSVICASTGNTSASLAAYAAKAGLQCSVLIPSGKIAYGKLSQAMIYGAKVIQVRSNFDEALNMVFNGNCMVPGFWSLPERLMKYSLEKDRVVKKINTDESRNLTDNIRIKINYQRLKISNDKYNPVYLKLIII